MAAPVDIELICSANPFSLAELTRGIASYAVRQAGWRLTVTPAGPGTAVETMRRSPARGLVLTLQDREEAVAAAAAGRVVVNVIGHGDATVVPTVAPDEEAIGRAGAAHLVELDRETLAFLGVTDAWSVEREAGFVAEAQRLGRRPVVARDDRGERPGWEEVHQLRWLPGWLEQLPKPAAVMVCSDRVATVVLSVCESLSLRIPDEVALLGVDNYELRCEFSRVPLSSIDANHTGIGYEAAMLLHRLLEGAVPPREPIRVPHNGVFVRRSTQRSSADPDVAAAAAFIRQHLDEPITVDNVAAHVHLSRSTLERRFRRHLGHAPGDELRLARLERARHMLLHTDLPLIQIVVATGFASQSYFTRAFARHFGSTPSAYRLRRHAGAPASPAPLSADE